MIFSALTLGIFATIGAARQCANLTVPLSLSSRNGVFNLKAPSNNIEATKFLLDLTRQGHNLTNELLAGYNTISGQYNVTATLCHPDSGPSSTVQILTHGIGFDRSYWDFPFANYNYSYVSQAVDAGYSTFALDRLGVGQSSRGEPINEIQLWLEVSALQAITSLLKQGDLPGALGTKFSKTINIGHSFGSAQAYALTVLYPDTTDAIILTGFSMNAQFVGFFGLGSNFIPANSVSALSSYPAGYLAPTSATGAQIDFFAPGQFDPEVLKAAFSTGQPVTPGELLTLGGAGAQINNFKGSVLVITGERDIPFCGGDCLATGNSTLESIPAGVAKSFPNVQNFEAFIVPKAGHGLNLEYSHSLTSTTILNYLFSNGLKA